MSRKDFPSPSSQTSPITYVTSLCHLLQPPLSTYVRIEFSVFAIITVTKSSGFGQFLPSSEVGNRGEARDPGDAVAIQAYLTAKLSW